ncbi:MAG: hypothetical protein WC796_06340 [Candidatus Pacearchaeota archaeon]|jgi:hypothetical protein
MKTTPLTRLEKIALRLISDSERRERVRFLLMHKELGALELLQPKGTMRGYSNCHGTTTFVVDYQVPIPIVNKDRLGLLAVIPATDRPGYVDREIMKEFLRYRCSEVNLNNSPDIFAIWYYSPRQKRWLDNTGVYLGKPDGKLSDLVFHQPTTEEPFELKRLSVIENRLIRLHPKGTIETAFYRFRG